MGCTERAVSALGSAMALCWAAPGHAHGVGGVELELGVLLHVLDHRLEHQQPRLLGHLHLRTSARATAGEEKVRDGRRSSEKAREGGRRRGEASEGERRREKVGEGEGRSEKAGRHLDERKGRVELPEQPVDRLDLVRVLRGVPQLVLQQRVAQRRLRQPGGQLDRRDVPLGRRGRLDLLGLLVLAVLPLTQQRGVEEGGEHPGILLGLLGVEDGLAHVEEP